MITVPKWLTAIPVSIVITTTVGLALLNHAYFSSYYFHVGPTIVATLVAVAFLIFATLPFISMRPDPAISLRNIGLSILVIIGTLASCIVVILSPAVIHLIHG